MIQRLALFLLPALLLAQQTTQNQTVQDRVVATVGDQVILESDVEEILNTLQAQFPSNGQNLQALRQQVLEELINQKLLYLEALKDTSIHVTPQEVEQAMDQQIQQLEQSMGKENFEAQLRQEGLTRQSLKDQYRERVKEQLYIQKLIDQRLRPRVVVTPDEVRRFYEEKKDSLPERPAMVQLQHILIQIKPSPAQVEKARKKAENLYQRLLKGEDFETLAMQYSDDPNTRDLGGDLGYIPLSQIQGPLHDTLANMEPGQISKPIEDEAGFHILKVDEKDGDVVHVRQILIRPVPTKADSAKAKTRAEALYRKLKDGTPFEELARRYSDDPFTRDNGGLVGYVPLNNLPEPLKAVAETLKVGTFSEPVLTEAGYYILKVLDRKPGGKPSFEEVQQDLKVLLEQRKLQAEIDRLTQELRKKYPVEIKEG